MKARAIPRPLRGGHETGCVVCGRPLVYSGRTQERECCVCHRVLPSDAVCEAGHFVCDDCHSGGGAAPFKSGGACRFVRALLQHGTDGRRRAAADNPRACNGIRGKAAGACLYRRRGSPAP